MNQTRRAFVSGVSGAFATIAIVRPARAAQFNLKYGHDLAASHPINVRSLEAFARIKAATKGAVEFATFPASQHGGDPAMFSQLLSGALEMATLPGPFINVSPIAQIENLAFAFATRDAALGAMDGELGKIIRDDFTSKNLVVFDKIWENGFRQITSNVKPIRNVADLAGLKIRIGPGVIRVDTFTSLGASPQTIPSSEQISALQSRVVDAQENSLLSIETEKIYTVQKYCSLTNHIWSGYWTFMNPVVWKSLPPNFQSIIRSEMDAAVLQARADNAQLAAALPEKLKGAGLAFNTDVDVASFKGKLKANGYYARWKKEFGEHAWTALEKYANKV